jgi:hypothetical protein
MEIDPRGPRFSAVIPTVVIAFSAAVVAAVTLRKPVHAEEPALPVSELAA